MEKEKSKEKSIEEMYEKHKEVLQDENILAISNWNQKLKNMKDKYNEIKKTLIEFNISAENKNIETELNYLDFRSIKSKGLDYFYRNYNKRHESAEKWIIDNIDILNNRKTIQKLINDDILGGDSKDGTTFELIEFEMPDKVTISIDKDIYKILVKYCENVDYSEIECLERIIEQRL